MTRMPTIHQMNLSHSTIKFSRCVQMNTFLKYKTNSRLTLDLTTTDKASLNEKRRQAFYRIRGKFDLETKGINAFNKEELKRLQDWQVISPREYKK